MNLEQDPDYNQALLEVRKYHPEPIGLTTYLGESKGDKTYPKQLNIIIALLIKINSKLVDLQEDINQIRNNTHTNTPSTSTFDLEKELENITSVLGNIKVDKKIVKKKETSIFGQLV